MKSFIEEEKINNLIFNGSPIQPQNAIFHIKRDKDGTNTNLALQPLHASSRDKHQTSTMFFILLANALAQIMLFSCCRRAASPAERNETAHWLEKRRACSGPG